MKIHYHSDHLGSASFVTDIGGFVVQHLQYLPYGELFVSQRNSEEFDSRYKFTAKELDNETSYTYFGARYYDSELSAWLSVDPMSDKYPSLSPYCYTANNPVVLVDPNGELIDEFNLNTNTGEIIKVSDKGGDKMDYYNIGTTNEKGEFQTTKTIEIERPEGGGNINSFRFIETDKSTISVFNIPGTEIQGYFLEPAGPSTTQSGKDQRIPEGTYNLENYSSKNHPDVFRIYNDNVSKDRRILIHIGNYPDDTAGCLLPGSSWEKDFVGNSGKMFNDNIKPYIKNIKAENVKLNIFNVIN